MSLLFISGLIILPFLSFSQEDTEQPTDKAYDYPGELPTDEAGYPEDDQDLVKPDPNEPRGVNMERFEYNDQGYPITRNGQLVLQPHQKFGFLIYKENNEPYQLYAQFANIQRDAVLLARLGDYIAVNPDGSPEEIQRGTGAIKLNTTLTSIVQGEIQPFFGDHMVEYRRFNLRDIYLGFSVGMPGLEGELRYVRKEAAVMFAKFGWNILGSFGRPVISPGFSRYLLPLTLGGGFRIHSKINILGGDIYWTFGGSVLFGFVNLLSQTDYPDMKGSVTVYPGVFIEYEKPFFMDKEEFLTMRNEKIDSGKWDRTDPRPYNYFVKTFFIRGGINFDFQTLGDEGPIKAYVAAGFRFNIIGPKIPASNRNRTETLYLSDYYIEQKKEERQMRREMMEELKLEEQHQQDE